MPNKLKSRFKSLPLSGKIVLLGSGLTLVSVFMPWYSDIDRFNIGDTFLGITGPLYLAGLIVLAASIISFGSIFSQLLGQKLPKINMKEHEIHLLSSGVSILMLVLSTSVFFHSKFGLNLTDKAMGVGLMTAFIGSGLTLLGAFLVKRGGMEIPEDLEPLIDISNDRVTGELYNSPVTEQETRPTREDAVQRATHEIDRSQTVEEAMQSGRIEIPDAPTKAWSPVEESINNMKYAGRSETNDIR